MNRSLASPPRILRTHLLLGQNVFHSGSVLMADIDPGPLSDATSGLMQPGFADRFHRLFDGPEQRPKGRAGHDRAPERDASLSHYLLEATLSLEARILSALGQQERPRYGAVDQRPDNTVVLIWSSALPDLSRDALAVAMTGIAELMGEPIPGALPFAEGLDDLMARAGRRRLEASDATLKAAADTSGIPCHVLDGQLMIGEGARQRKPFGNDAFWTAHEGGPEAPWLPHDAPRHGSARASVVRLVPRVALGRGDAQAIIDRIFPDPREAVIPSLVFAGDLATSAAAAQAGAMLEAAGLRVGMALKSGVVLGGAKLEPPEGRITRASAMLLRDPSTEAMVTALSLRRIVNHGLGFARCDGVALQLAPDADPMVNERGIDVLARACAGPFTIDAGHPACRMVIDRIGPGRTILVSQSADDARAGGHLAAGGLVATRQWGADGPLIRLLRRDGVLASAPLESRARTRDRLIYAGMHAFALVQAAGLLRHRAA